MSESEIRRRSIDTIRALSMDAVQTAGAGHPGTAMALAPLAYLLYTEVMRTSPSNPQWPGRDRFVLSAGHACILQYSTLHLTGYNLSLEELKRFRQWESITPGHPEHFLTPGIETTTGPLGQGFANGVGMAIAERFLADRFNRPRHEIVDHRVYCICSDGDMMEGVSNEAASIAGQLGLGKLVYFYDDNRITIDGTTSISFSVEDRGARLEAQGWHVQHVDDVEDLDALREAIGAAQAEVGRPSMIVVRSHIAYPAPDAVDTAKAHGSPLGEDEVRATKEVMGFDPDAHFAVDEAVYEHMSQVARGIEAEQEWKDRFERWTTAFPAVREEWDQVHTGKPRAGFAEALPEWEAGESLATRAAGKAVMQAFMPYTPTMIGGSGDLVESTYTEFIGGGLFSATQSGRNVPFGIREHAAASIVNGLAVHGGIVKPYASTFLTFSDYMRPAVRLSALMGTEVVWVYTHDSVGLGEDGPTHQPIEHYAALRAIPNLWFVRPADANETAYAWKVALEREGGPVALSFSRQKVPTLDRSDLAPASGVERGAYALWDSGDGEPDLILIATGAEVGVTLEAGRKLAGGGSAVRVVSMPCWELFELQPAEYRDEVLPPHVGARLAVEPGVSLGWHRWVGDRGGVVALDRFGASAPGTEVLERLGYTVDNIAARAAALLERVS
ncbi:MAG TPA: transketolase [Gaiellaceae bacterium]|nr:transketolase [Gaiellaceae bacterium]